MRYLDAPVFVSGSSVISQYELAGDVSANAGLNTVFSPSVGADNTLNAGASMRWADRPSITYIPLSGREFSESLMTPLSPEALFGEVLNISVENDRPTGVIGQEP